MDKTLTEFSRGKQNGYHAWCKLCVKAYDSLYYKQNKHRRPPQRKADRERKQDYIFAYLSKNPCVDCGESDPVVLEFDHINGNKIAAIADYLTRSILRIKSEIDKCVVRCANCHRRKTAKELGYYRYKD